MIIDQRRITGQTENAKELERPLCNGQMDRPRDGLTLSSPKAAKYELVIPSELMGGSLPLAYYNALQEERGEPGPGGECGASEPVPRVVTTRTYGWCLPRRMEGGQDNKVMPECWP